MIIFNGVEMTDVAPVKIDDIQVSPISLSPVSRSRAIEWGADFVRMGGGTRTVTVSFALLEEAYADREKHLQALRDWAKTDREYTMELPHFENRHLECVCTAHPDTSYRKWWENRLRFVFTCFNNPYWTSNQLIEVPCGQNFSIGGSAQPLITIERTGVTGLTNQTYSGMGGSMQFSQIPAGTLTIDLNRQTAAIGKTSIMRYYVPTSTWIVPKVAANQVINGAGTVKYRERWV